MMKRKLPRTMYLLGAGASVDAGIPPAKGLCEQIVESLKVSTTDGAIVNYVYSGLVFKRGIQRQHALGGVDIEQLISALDLLSNRKDLEIAPFITAWQEGLTEFGRSDLPINHLRDVILNEAITPLIPTLQIKSNVSRGRTIQKAIDNKRHLTKADTAVADIAFQVLKEWMEGIEDRRSKNSEAFTSAFKKAVESLVAPTSDRQFERAALAVIKKLTAFVWLNDKADTSYLAGLFTRCDEPIVTIATLNYDNTVELAAANAGVPCDTGIKRWVQTGQVLDSDAREGVVLLKLHGSLDWAYTRNTKLKPGCLPRREVETIPDDDVRSPKHIPAIRFGQRNKLTAEGPFLDLLAAFRTELMKAQVLTVIGYSFRDDHINEYIAQWFNSSPTRTLVIVDPDVEVSENKFLHAIRDLGDARVQRHPSMARDWLLNSKETN